MYENTWQWIAGTPALVVAALTFGADAAIAASGDAIPGYAASSGAVVKTSDGACVKTSDWKKERVLEACDPKLHAELHPKPEPAVAEIAAVVPITVAVDETLDVRALFGFAQSALTAEAIEELDALAERLGRFTRIDSVRITGYADRVGSAEYNLALSKKRAEAVGTYLRQSANIPTDKFEVDGLGSAHPIKSCEDTRGSALIQCLGPNRRVEVEIHAERNDVTPGVH